MKNPLEDIPQELLEKEGWSDSVIRTTTLTIHYYKGGVSLCGRSHVDLGNRHFNTDRKHLSDAYSHHCKMCIKKQIKMLDD